MRRRSLVLLAVAAAAVLLVVVARLLASPLLHPALGFGAKVGCSGVFVGGATVPQVVAGFPDERLRRLVRVRVDEQAGEVEAAVPLLARRRAVHRPGLGCTLDPVGDSIRTLPSQPHADGLAARDEGMPWPQGSATMAPPAAFDAAHLAAVVDSAFLDDPSGRRPGTQAVAIVHGGRLIMERYADGYSAQHRFAGWSMAKSVTAALAGILAHDGRLSLEAAELRPEWREDARGRITLHQLMQMSSGLAFDESYTPAGGATRMLFNSADVAAAAAASPLQHEPGTHWHYSSGTTNLIAWHLRTLFGSDDAAWIRFPRARLFEPVGMLSAVLEPDATGTFVGSSFMYATAQDWARFGLLHLQDGVWEGQRILAEDWVRYSTAPAAAAPQGRYGAQWWLNAGDATNPADRPWPYLPPDIYYASGFQGQYVVIVPSRDLVVVRLGQTVDDGAWRLGPFLRSVLATMRSPASS